MPNVNVLKKELFASIGKTFTDHEFEDLCFPKTPKPQLARSQIK